MHLHAKYFFQNRLKQITMIMCLVLSLTVSKIYIPRHGTPLSQGLDGLDYG